jgi:hypothetical protein
MALEMIVVFLFHQSHTTHTCANAASCSVIGIESVIIDVYFSESKTDMH